MTAHPRIDPATGEMWFFANFPSGRLSGDIGLYVADAGGRIVRSEIIAGPLPALIHDFAISEHYVIFAVCPATVSMKRAIAGGALIAWEPELGTHLGVMPRAGGAEHTRWFAGPPRMVWHLMNAFDHKGRITIDLCEQDAAVFASADGAPPDMSRASQYLARWEVDWDGPREFVAARLSDVRCEYPRFDERRTGQPYRQGYVACDGGPGSGDLFHRGLGRFDHARGAMRVWSAGSRCAVAEPVFAVRPGGGEGEGYLITNIYDEDRNASHLAIFDAEDLEHGPIARAHLDHRVPVGFHALWTFSRSKAAVPIT